MSPEGHTKVEKVEKAEQERFKLTGKPAKTEVGELIRRHREALGWTVERASAEAECSTSCWKNYEAGRIDSIRKLRKLAKLLKFDVSVRVGMIELCE